MNTRSKFASTFVAILVLCIVVDGHFALAQAAPPPIDSSLAGSPAYQAQTSSGAGTTSTTPQHISDHYANTDDVDKAVAECVGLPTSVKEVADKACGDAQSDKGMTGQEKAMLVSGLAAVAQVGAQIAAAKGSAMACMLGQGLSTTLQGLTMVKASACNRSRNKCNDKCSTIADKLTRTTRLGDQEKNKTEGKDVNLIAAGDYAFEVRSEKIAKAVEKCAGYEENQMMMAMQMQQLIGGAAQMANCKSQTSDSNTAGIVPPNGATPLQLSSAPGDCSDPSFAASSYQCQCQGPNPTNPLCGNGPAGSTHGTGGLATGGVGSPGIGDGSGSGEGSIVDTTPVKGAGEAGKQVSGSGGGAGGGSAGGGGGLNPDGSGSGDGTSGINKDVITGQSGSSGGLSSGGAGGGAGGGLARSGGGSGSGGGGFNLSKYLPKNLFKNRGLAGMTVPAQDGVTGPLGPSIWEKVHTRYEDKKSSLILDK